MKHIISFLTLMISFNLFANHVGIVVKKQGDAELLTSPSRTISGSGKHVLFEGLYYVMTPVRLGTKILNGNILRTGKDSKLKVVFKNGDQYNVWEATSYKIAWSAESAKKKDPSTIDLMYGSLRGVIDKEGPRSGTKIKTKHSIMGVRGTDFYIAQKGTSGETEISVLRGNVAVSDQKDPSQTVKVSSGFSAEIKTLSSESKASLQVVKTSKQDLIEIQKDSKIDEKKADKVEDKKLEREITQLEKKAVDNTLKDIKVYDPKLYENLKKKNIKSTDALNTVAVSKVFEKAPVKKSKPGLDEVDLEENAYEKYFKIEDL